MTTQTVKFWIAIDADGEFHVDKDCAQDAADNVGNFNRVYEIDMTLQLPVATQVAATIPDTDGPVTMTITT